MGSVVTLEWNTRAPEVLDDVKKHLVEIQDQASHFHDAAGVLGIGLTFGRPSYPTAGLADALHDLSKRLLDSALPLDPDAACIGRAFHRVVNNAPPSKKGGEVKDCAVVEECLEVSRRLLAAGFTRKRVFCTSNVNDYCDATRTLHSNLTAEFAAVGITFTKDLPWAVHEIKT